MEDEGKAPALGCGLVVVIAVSAKEAAQVVTFLLAAEEVGGPSGIAPSDWSSSRQGVFSGTVNSTSVPVNKKGAYFFKTCEV